MLSDEELELIKAKMKQEHIFGATFAKRLGVTKQAIHCILKRKCRSKHIESYLREWLLQSVQQ